MNWGVGKDWGQLHGGRSEARVSQGDISSGGTGQESSRDGGGGWGFSLIYTTKQFPATCCMTMEALPLLLTP